MLRQELPQQLPQYNHPDIKDIYDELIKKHNFYIGVAIKNYLDEIFEKINNRVKVLELDDQCANQVSLAFIRKFSTLPFTLAYIQTYTQKGMIQRASSDPLDFDLDPYSFKRFVEDAKQIPEVKSIDSYISKVLGITDRKHQLISTVRNIKNVINEYAGENKQDYIKSFNSEIDQFLSSANQKSYFDLRSDYDNVSLSIKKLQRDETSYYAGRFFADYRRSNSSLQPKIDKARSYFNDFIAGDNDNCLQRKAR